MKVLGKVALVTGGARGIGFACVGNLLENGAKGVAIADIDEASGQEAVENYNAQYNLGNVIFIKTDVRCHYAFEAAFKKTVEKFGQVDILINQAGILDEINWELAYETNIKGPTIGCLLGIDKYLQMHKGGEEAVIINMSSYAGLSNMDSSPMYSTTRHALVGLTRCYGSEYHFNRTGVKVICICPTVTDTPMLPLLVPNAVYIDRIEEVLGMLYNMSGQTAQDLANCVNNIIETAGNGTVWMVHKGKMILAEFPNFKALLE